MVAPGTRACDVKYAKVEDQKEVKEKSAVVRSFIGFVKNRFFQNLFFLLKPFVPQAVKGAGGLAAEKLVKY